MTWLTQPKSHFFWPVLITITGLTPTKILLAEPGGNGPAGVVRPLPDRFAPIMTTPPTMLAPPSCLSPLSVTSSLPMSWRAWVIHFRKGVFSGGPCSKTPESNFPDCTIEEMSSSMYRRPCIEARISVASAAPSPSNPYDWMTNLFLGPLFRYSPAQEVPICFCWSMDSRRGATSASSLILARRSPSASLSALSASVLSCWVEFSRVLAFNSVLEITPLSKFRIRVSVIPTRPSKTPSRPTPPSTSTKPIIPQRGTRFRSGLDTSQSVNLGLALHHFLNSRITSGSSNAMPTATMTVDISKRTKYLSASESIFTLSGELNADVDPEVCKMRARRHKLLMFMRLVYGGTIIYAIHFWRKG
jgi:hypothetical protein